MNLALLLNVHENSPVVIDTLESIFTYATKDVLVLVDGVAWNQFNQFDFPVSLMCGFKHGCPKSPYRNMALGLKMLAENWPDADWYCYTEYDVLFTSDRFKKNLEIADKMGVWMLGNDGRLDDKEMPLIEAMLGSKFKSYYYLLGACQFFSREFMQKMVDMNFFDRLLSLTNQFTEGYMPGYCGYDVSEHLYPSLCRHLGGNVGVFASYDQTGKWHGHYKQFPIRWRPSLDPETENFTEASIMHPLKNYDHPIRTLQRELRNGI
jgi:hypothetical protein